jgi:hypothetical protein
MSVDPTHLNLVGLVGAVSIALNAVLAWYLKKAKDDRGAVREGQDATIKGLQDLNETYKKDREIAEKKLSLEEKRRKESETAHFADKSAWLEVCGELKSQLKIFEGDVLLLNRKVDLLQTSYDQLKIHNDKLEAAVLLDTIEKMEADWSADKVLIAQLKKRLEERN